MKKYFSIKNRFVLFITYAVVIPSFLINLVISTFYISYMNDRVKDNYNYLSTMSYNNAYNMYLVYDRMFNKIMNETEIITAVKKLNHVSDLHTSIKLSQEIDSKIKAIALEDETNNICQITIYPLNSPVPPIGTYVASTRSIMHKEWFNNLKKRNKYMYISKQDKRNIMGISMYLYDDADFFDSKETIAIVNMEIDLSLLFNNTIIDQNKFLRIELYDEDSNEFVSYGNSIEDIKSSKQYILEKNFISNNWKIRYIFNMREEYNVLWFVVITLSIITVILLLLEMFIGFRFSNGINSRVEFIIKKLRRIQQGNWANNETLTGNDEFTAIDDGLNVMSNQIETLINENYIIEIEKKKSEIMALQMQINPHFMYNTLESISSIAKSNSCDEIAVICQKMSDVLRYNLNKEEKETVTLEQEIKQIDNYLQIQKIRFGDRINVFYDIPVDLKNAVILKFLLQPIIENVVKHVIQKDLERHMIVITASTNGTDLSISVIDDGYGITEQDADKIKAHIETIKTDKASGIGLKNINSRLKLIFGEEYGLSLKSVKDAGTEVTAKMPLKIGEKNV